MALEDQIAALITQATANLALPQTIANGAAAVIAQIGQQYSSRVSGLATTFFVSATGSDSNDGLSQTTTLFTIDEALKRTPRGGLCTVYLCSNYGMNNNLLVDGKHLVIQSPNATRFAIGFNRTQETIGNTIVRSLNSFEIMNGGSVRCVGIGLIMPAGDGVFLNLPQDVRSAIFRNSVVSNSLDYKAGLYYCDLNFPDNNFGPMMGTTGLPTDLAVNNCNLVGQPMDGKWLFNVASGTVANTLAYLRTSLATL